MGGAFLSSRELCLCTQYCSVILVQVPEALKTVLSWHCGIDVKNNLSIQKAEVGELGGSNSIVDSGKKSKSVSPPGPCAAALLIVRGLESCLKQKKDISGRDSQVLAHVFV